MTTPKTLKHAIFNYFEDKGRTVTAEEIDGLENYIRDFMSQKFQLFMLPPGQEPNLAEKTAAWVATTLWAKITGDVP